MQEKENYLKALPFWDHLSESEKMQARQGSRIAEYQKGQLVFSAAEECLGMIYVIEGAIRTYVVSDEGREITLFKLSPGESCVLSASCAMNQIDFETAMAAEADSRILILGMNVFGNFMKNNLQVENFANRLIAERFSTVMWVMQQILFYGIDRRLAEFLLRETEAASDKALSGADDRRPVLKMTHEEIAREVNSAREVVARMLKRFENEGLVQLKRGQITLLNREELAEIAGRRN